MVKFSTDKHAQPNFVRDSCVYANFGQCDWALRQQYISKIIPSPLSICRSTGREIDGGFQAVSAILLFVLLFILQVLMLPNGPHVSNISQRRRCTDWLQNQQSMLNIVLCHYNMVNFPHNRNPISRPWIVSSLLNIALNKLERAKMVSIDHRHTKYLVQLIVPFSEKNALATLSQLINLSWSLPKTTVHWPYRSISFVNM